MRLADIGLFEHVGIVTSARLQFNIALLQGSWQALRVAFRNEKELQMLTFNQKVLIVVELLACLPEIHQTPFP